VRIAVIGIGNVLTGDDAVGPTVVRMIEAAFEAPTTSCCSTRGRPASTSPPTWPASRA